MFSSIGVHRAAGQMAISIAPRKEVHVADIGFTQMNHSSATTEILNDKPSLL
jgi:hypothetical protein